jgi:bile acid-coenzyme A ligase
VRELAVVETPSNNVPLGDVLTYHAAHGDGPALTHDDTTLSFSELARRAARRAQLLASLGVRRDDIVIVALPNSIEFFETTFALWKLGATPCPVSPRLPSVEMAAIVGAVQPGLIIGGDAAIDGFAWLAAGSVPDPSLPVPVDPSPVATCWKALTSGGSTGRPKVILTRLPGMTDPERRGTPYSSPAIRFSTRVRSITTLHSVRRTTAFLPAAM